MLIVGLKGVIQFQEPIMVLNHGRTQDYLISTQLIRAFKTPLAPFTKRITLEKTVEKFRLSGHQQKDEYTMMENTDLRLK